MTDASVFRIAPYHYVHVLDNNSNVTRVEVGPKTFTRQEHERIVHGPTSMITVPPRSYCVIENPTVKDAQTGRVVLDPYGQAKLRHGDKEIRFEGEPFPLYPGEKLCGKVTNLTVVQQDSALRLIASRDFTDENSTERKAGDEWLFRGPGTYVPRVEVQVVEIIRATVLKPNQALMLRARKELKDYNGKERKAGEEWLVRAEGAYLPEVQEEIVRTVDAFILTEKIALHLQAKRNFTDIFGTARKAGEEWLVTLENAEAYIPDVYEHVVGTVDITTLSNRQYCVIIDPYDETAGRNRFGVRVLRKGETTFFLRPGERLENGIQEIYVLASDEALLLAAREEFSDDDGDHKPGDRWMVRGPKEYIPSVEMEVLELRRAIPLDENEGIYIRDIQSGKVRAHIGETYLVGPQEELWEKELPSVVEDLLSSERDPLLDRSGSRTKGEATRRDKTRVVSFRVPHNAAVQIYDYKAKEARVCFGPDQVMLLPDEQFTVLALSGGKPKKPNVIRTAALLLGPDFMTDIVTVETSDHARLQLQLSYNWHFGVDRSSAEDAAGLFQVPDFVGDACKAIASRIRGAVAAEPFDSFHKCSAKIIRRAVFGMDASGKIGASFQFLPTKLTITNIDIQSVEPVDQRTRDALQKSVQLAIEITTKAQEASARHEAERAEQEARGRLERQKIQDEAQAEKARKDLLELQTESAAVESKGQAIADALARAESAKIEGQAAVEHAKSKAEAARIESEAELDKMTRVQQAEYEHKAKMIELELKKSRELNELEVAKFRQQVEAIGASTIAEIARAGPEMQAQLLKGLGLQGFMITDGKSPINLFSTAQGFINGVPSKETSAE